MTAEQAALFDAPQHPDQAPLWGPTFEWAPDPAGPELMPDDRGELDRAARVRAQRDKLNARWQDVTNHRLQCGNCIPGARPCRDGRKAEAEVRIAGDVLPRSNPVSSREGINP
jgi:hypothetical protein